MHQVDGLFGELREKVKQMLADTSEEHRTAELAKKVDLGVAVRRFGLTLHLFFDDVLESARPLVLAGEFPARLLACMLACLLTCLSPCMPLLVRVSAAAVLDVSFTVTLPIRVSLPAFVEQE